MAMSLVGSNRPSPATPSPVTQSPAPQVVTVRPVSPHLPEARPTQVRTPAPKLAPGVGEVPASLNLSEGSAFAKDLMLSRTIIRCPDWAMRAQGSQLLLGGQEVTGKHTGGTLGFDIDPPDFPVFRRIVENTRLISRVISSYTIVDAEDGFRLISMHKRTEFIARLTKLNDQRMELAQWLDDNWQDIIIPLIEQEHPEHFEWMKGRLPMPSFKGRMEVVFRLRPVGALGPDQIDPTEWEGMSEKDRDKAIAKLISDAEKMAQDRARALVDGVMQPILDLALKVQGKLPNPNYDPSKPKGSKNMPYEAGIDSGRKTGGFLDGLQIPLERLTNFSQYMTPAVLKQAQAALRAVGLANGSPQNLNASVEIQNAIKLEIQKLSDQITNQKDDTGRRERQVRL